MNTGGRPRTLTSRPGSVGVRGSSPLSSTSMTRPVLLRESGLSRLWLQLALPYLSAVGSHAVGGFAGQGRHDVALSVHRRAHLAVAEHLLDEPRVFLSMGQP